MAARPLAAVSIALALVLPLGSVVVPTTSAFDLLATPAPGATQILHQAPEGPFVSLAGLVRLVKGGLHEAAPKTEPYPVLHGLDVAGNDHPGWLRNVHGAGFGEVAVLDGPLTATHTTVLIDTNVVITGAVTYDHSTLVFTTPDAGHRTLTVARGGSLTITNSLVKNANGDRLDYGLIQGVGALTLTNNRFEQITVYAQEDLGYTAEPQQTLSNNFFTNTLYGVLVERDNVTLQRNTFYANNYGVKVIDVPGLVDPPPDLRASNPTVLENTFEMNEYGIQIYTDQDPANGEPVGLYRNNLVRANLVGVQCYSAGWAHPDDPEVIRKPRLEGNNIHTNYGDAVNNLRGITIIVPFVGAVGVADSSCELTGNYYGTDSLFLSSADTNTNVQTSPVSLPNNPPLPKPITIITTSTTWNAANPPPTLNGPVAVQSGTLTIQGITLSSAYLLGAIKGGRIIVDNVVVTNGNGIVLRNDNDQVKDSEFYGTLLFDPVTVWRNNATVNDNVIVGSGRDRNAGLGLYAGQFTEDFTWSPDALRNDVSNLAFGAVTFTTTVTLTGNDFHDLGSVENAYPLALLLDGGVAAVLATIDSDDNTFTRVPTAYSSQLLTLNSDGDDYDGGVSAFNSALLNTLTYNDVVISNYEFGLLTTLETSLTVTDSNLTYNGYGLFAALYNPSVSTTNFYNNYLASMLAYTTSVAGQHVTSTVTCTSCWSPSDEAHLGGIGSSVVYSGTLGNVPNTVRSPPWADDATEARGASSVVTLTSGTLAGPVIARGGGEVRVVDADIDMAGRFLIGAKGGGNSGGATGKVTITGSRFTNTAMLMLNSTASTVANNDFRDFRSGGDLFNVHYNPATFECNRVTLDGGYPGRVLEQLAPGSTTFRRNLFLDSGDLDVGVGLAGDTYHRTRGFVFEQNGVRDITSALGAVRILQNGTHSVADNNFFNGETGRAVTRSSQNYTQPTVVNPTPLDARNSYWGAASGPVVHFRFDQFLNPGAEGLGLRVLAPGATEAGENNAWPKPDWTPYRTVPAAFDPCLGWRYGPSGPLDFQTLQFDSGLTFDPSGFDLASQTWDFNGEGSSTEANPTFKFPDGGSKTVTLTVTTAGGRTASLSKTVQVAHSAPVAAFGNTAADETTAMQLTDASTHPNSPVDAAPAGWTYAWDLNGETTSAQRNPVHTFLDGGAKVLRLTVTDNDGQTHSVQRTVAVAHVPPVADFTVTGSLETDTYQLTDASTHPNAPTDGIVTRAWSCTDGFTSAALNPTHRFADGGAHSCTLTVTDNDGLSSTVTRSIAVGHVAPAADFLHGAANELQAMAFTDATTHPNPADAPPAGYVYAWTFGDGGQSGVRNPSRDYADGGTYAVGLTVTDDDGQSSSISRTVTIPHVPPVAAFSLLPANPEPGDPVQFTDLSTHPNTPVDSVVAWSWAFGDGATSTDRHPAHTYQANGLFDAVLTVTDDDGLTASLTVRIPVGNTPPVAAFGHSPAAPTTLDPVQFTDLSTDEDGTLVAWLWAFGDGTTSTEQDPVHQFPDDGVYTVTLVVTDDLGAASTASVALEVLNVAPGASFGFGPESPVVNEEVTFADHSEDPDGTIVAWAWDFGDGTGSTAQHPTHTFTGGGDYTLTLTVVDDDGAVTSTTRTLHVCETGLDPESLRLELCLRVEL